MNTFLDPSFNSQIYDNFFSYDLTKIPSALFTLRKVTYVVTKVQRNNPANIWKIYRTYVGLKSEIHILERIVSRLLGLLLSVPCRICFIGIHNNRGYLKFICRLYMWKLYTLENQWCLKFLQISSLNNTTLHTYRATKFKYLRSLISHHIFKVKLKLVNCKSCRCLAEERELNYQHPLPNR